jgi:toxin ParE1/3/4
MPRVIRTPQANLDLLEIWDYIDRDNTPAADKLVRRIDEAFATLARNPQMGALHEEYRPGLRTFAVGNYIIFYRAMDDGIEVYRVLHGARRLEDLL